MSDTFSNPQQKTVDTGLTLEQIMALQNLQNYTDEQQRDSRDQLLYGRKRDIINLNSKRYKGLGKRKRLKRDLNESAGQALVWDGQKTRLAGEIQKDGFSNREARKLLRTRTGSGKYNYSPESQYDLSTNEGRFNQKVYDYFHNEPDATVAKWDPYARLRRRMAQQAVQKPVQQQAKKDADKFFSGFGDNDQYLNRLYALTSDKSKYRALLDAADTSKDGLLSPDELNKYASVWYKNSPFYRNGIADPMNYVFQNQMGITDDQLKSQSGYYNMPIWYNWKQNREAYTPSSGWQKIDEDGSGDSNYYVDDANAYRRFLNKQYGLDDKNIESIFGKDYASALKKIEYVPVKDHENYFNYEVMDKFNNYLQNNIYNSPNWKYENQRWSYVPTNKKGGVLKMRNINFFQKGGAAKDTKKEQASEQQTSQPTEEQLIQMAIFGVIGYAASQQKQISIEDAIKNIAAIIKEEPDQIQQIASDQDLVNAGYQIAQKQEPEVAKQIMQPGVAVDAVEQVMQQQVQAARRGAKLNYLRSLKGECPDGYYKAYYKAGGQICAVCKKKQERQEKVQSAKCGKKMKRGSITKAVDGIRTDISKRNKTLIP